MFGWPMAMVKQDRAAGRVVLQAAVLRMLAGIGFLTALISLMSGPLAGTASGAEQEKLAVVVAEGTASPTGGTFSLKTIDPSGAPIDTLFSRPAVTMCGTSRCGNQVGSVSWSPDASKVAYYQIIPASTGQIDPGASGIFLSPGGQVLPWDLPNLNMNWFPAWSPTGDELAYWAYTSQGFVLRTIHPDGSGMRPVAGGGPNPAGASQPAWSPDGNTIAFSSAPGPDQGGNLLKVPAAGGTATFIAPPAPDGSRVGQPAYSPDGKSIAFIRQQLSFPSTTPPYRRLVVRDLGTGVERTVTDTYVSQAPTKVSWSPDGKRIAYIEANPGCGVGGPGGCDLVSIKADGTDKRVILHADYIASVAWSTTSGPNYYVKHIEVAQALGQDLPTPNPDNAEAEDPIPFPWRVPSLGGFPMPLIDGRRTLLRIYVGDASLKPGEIATRTIHYSVTIGGTTHEGDETFEVTAPDRDPDQKAGSASIKAWIPAVDSHGVIPRVAVEVNSDESETECGGCYPKGNRASVNGIAFEPGGDLTLAPVPINLIDPDGTIRQPGERFQSVWSAVADYLPVREGPLLGRSPFSLVATLRDLDSASLHFCEFVVTQLEAVRRVSTAPASEHWVGIAPALDFGCNGISSYGSKVLFLNDPIPETLTHELGHSLGLRHTLSLAGRPPAPEGHPLPYRGIGVVGYRGERPSVLNPGLYSDVMGYAPRRWTSPATWWRMHQAILGQVAINSGASSRRATASGGGSADGQPRRLVTGYLAKKRGEIFSSLVANVTTPNDRGSTAGWLVALDGRGAVVARARVTGKRLNEGGGKTLPFVVALPASPNAVSLQLRTPNGSKLATLHRSPDSPSARFLRLRRRARANRPFIVRWRATDRDDDSLSVTLLARRRGVWHPITMGPAAFHARVKPWTIGRGKALRLRLLVSDGFNTTTVKAGPLRLR